MKVIFDGPLQTDSGMFGLWDYEYFKVISSYGIWESFFLNDAAILQQIKIGKFVPINIHSDGGFGFLVKIEDQTGISELTEREKLYVVASSEEFLIKLEGNVCISGIEYINKKINPGYVGKSIVEIGEYEVTVHLIDWTKEPGMQKKDKTPKKGALPDFIILINKRKAANKKFRVSINTFSG